MENASKLQGEQGGFPRLSLEYRLYYRLCLLLVLLTVFSTGITLYRSLYDVVDNVYHYSNQLLERARHHARRRAP